MDIILTVLAIIIVFIVIAILVVAIRVGSAKYFAIRDRKTEVVLRRLCKACTLGNE
jgi:Na+-transporting methylmalonyl-CoA/oxaloacetate decarboxylase gamma subunit